VQDGRCFVVMELVPGRPLDQVLRERRALPPLEAAALTAQVADALAEAHRGGIIHCDVKPQNIIVMPDGSPKLVDFGIARAVSTTSGVRPAEILGSAPYLAPEQARGERLDARTDVYALGTVLFELLTGRPAFTGHSAAEIIAQRLVGEPPSPRSFDANIPPELERTVLTALAGDPRRRYQTARDFAVALRRAASDVSAEALARTAPIESGPLRGVATLRSSLPTAPVSSRPRGRAGRVAAMAFLVLGALWAATIAGWPMALDRVALPEAVLAPLAGFRPTPSSTVAPRATPTVPRQVLPSGPAPEGGTGARGAAQEAKRKAEEAARKQAEAAEKQIEALRKQAEAEARTRIEVLRKQAEAEARTRIEALRRQAEAEGRKHAEEVLEEVLEQVQRRGRR
jgi:hypothetical protein